MKNPELPPAMAMGLRMQGQYRCVLNQGTKQERDSGWFDNLITNGGLDRIGDSAAMLYCSVGTGTAAAAYTDNALQAFVAAAANGGNPARSEVGATAPNYEFSEMTVFRFNQGAAVGNMAEVGVGWVNNGTGLWSRARILDGVGAPTTLTVTAIDQLSVYYKLTHKPVLTDRTGVVNLSGTDYAYTARLCEATGFSFNFLAGGTDNFILSLCAAHDSSMVLVPITNGWGSYQEFNVGTLTPISYVPGNRYRDTLMTIPPGKANFAGGLGGITILISQNRVYRYVFTTPIPKDNTKTLSLTFRVAWDRI